MEDSESMEWENDGNEEISNYMSLPSVESMMDLIMMDIDESPQNIQSVIFFVPDTNVFISSLDFIELIVGEDQFFGQLQLVLPWTVLQELDGLRKNNRNAQKAINLINSLLIKKNAKLRAQKPSEVAIAKESFETLNNDDEILQCALQMCKFAPSASVIFSSNDKNLRNKAMIVNDEKLVVCDGTSAETKIRSLISASEPATNDTTTEDTNSCTLNSTDKSNFNRPIAKPKKKFYFNPKNLASTPDISTNHLSKIGGSDKSIRKRKSSSPAKKLDVEVASFSPLRKRSGTGVHSSTIEIIESISCNSFEEALELVRAAFSFIIEYQMKEDYGENWKKVVKIPPPWTLEKSIKCMLGHWIAVFSFVFGKKKEVLDRMYSLLAKWKGKKQSKVLEEEILQASVVLFNLADNHKCSIAKEPRLLGFKRSIVNYIEANKNC